MNAVSLPHDDAHQTDIIETARLQLTPMGADVLQTFVSGERNRACELLHAQIVDARELQESTFVMRLDQLQADPTLRQWLLRAIIRRSDRMLIGHIGFHSAPDPDYLRALAPGAVEIGYRIFTPYRRNGYALEAASALLRWAHTVHGVRHIVASVSPDNIASLALLHRLAADDPLQKIGNHIDPIDGLEEIYLLCK